MKSFSFVAIWLVVCLFAAYAELRFLPHSAASMPADQAAYLRGGARCKKLEPDGQCEQCLSNKKCNTNGNHYKIEDVLFGPCFDAEIVNEYDCDGSFLQCSAGTNCMVACITIGPCIRKWNVGSQHTCSGSCP